MEIGNEIIKFENATKKFNSKTIIKDFNLGISSGEKLAFKACSGSGKTTLLNLIMGFTRLDGGQIYIKGEIPTSKNIYRLRANISWLPQNVDTIGRDESVYKVIQRPFRYSANKDKLPSWLEIEEIAYKLNLDSALLNNPFRNLSGGEKQRVGLMICSLLDAPVILLDEPTSALDKTSTEKAIDLIMTNKKKTIISATHDDLWLGACTRIIELDV